MNNVYFHLSPDKQQQTAYAHDVMNHFVTGRPKCGDMTVVLVVVRSQQTLSMPDVTAVIDYTHAWRYNKH